MCDRHHSAQKKPGRLAQKQRKKLWELEDRLHCSLIGTCLNIEELQKLARKIGIPKKDIDNDYSLHCIFVGIIGERSAASRLVNKTLDRKYRQSIRQLRSVSDPQQLHKHWQEALANGKIAALYWTLITHPSVSEAMLYDVYGEVHMLSHLSGASLRVNMQSFILLRQKVPALEQQLKIQHRDAQAVLSQRKKTIHELKQKLVHQSAAEKRCSQLEKCLQHHEQGGVLDDLRNQVVESSAQIATSNVRMERAETNATKWKQRMISLWERNTELESILEEISTQRDALEAMLEQSLAPDCASCEVSDQCNNELDLCNRRVLFVGGRNRQCAHYRALVEQRNGEFIHHDGGLAESNKRLPNLLARADMVLCPLDCISHDAMNLVKRGCKQNGTPLQFMPRSSLAAFTQGLQEVASG